MIEELLNEEPATDADMKRALVEFAKVIPEFTSEFAWKHVEEMYGRPRRGAVGMLFKQALVDPGLVVRVGHTKATRPQANGRQIAIWKSTLCPAEDEMQSLQTTLAGLRSRVNLHDLSIDDALRTAYEWGAQSNHAS